jgi:hypothetical protein
MKTAMQELIEIYEYYHSFEEFNEWFMDMGKKAMLEKEKEQIIKAMNYGLGNEKEIELGEYYYNQTYNQNK